MDYTDKYNLWQENAVDDPDISAELCSVKGNENEIKERFSEDLAFGTGGLRGIIGAGTARMNIYTVAQASVGLAKYLNSHFDQPSAAIAYDSRIKSKLFAETAAGILARENIAVFIFDKLMPTPALSFAVRQLGCSGGIVITASHNPAEYNGYKVYGSDGCQITQKAADEISDHIKNADPFNSNIPFAFEEGLKNGRIKYISEDIKKLYIDKVSALSVLGRQEPRNISVVYTPLNGAGISCIPECLKNNGFGSITIPDTQAYPDGNFPTCPYPNPEEKEALTEGICKAEEIGADIVLATDPDCDRVGAAVRSGEGYRRISGNEMGVLLLDFICRMRLQNGDMPELPVAVKTIVTTPMAEKIAENYGVGILNVLTGFKYIGEQIALLEKNKREHSYIFGFEESCGYLSGIHARDKDAVNASLLICEMTAWYKEKNMTLEDAINELYKEYGYYIDRLESYTFKGLEGKTKMDGIMRCFRENGYKIMPDISGTDDYLNGINGLPISNVIQYRFTDGSLVTVRPSGTEPKIKLYYSVCQKDSAMTEQRFEIIKESFKKVIER